jgi:ABC-type multidrug transport system ATPase subunit
VLQVEKLGKRFAQRWIFRGIGFSLEKGHSLVVLGDNGAGKSTLLKLLAGLLPATEGSINPPDGDPRLNIGYSALDLSLYGHLTLAEHLRFSAAVRGCPARTGELLEFVHLHERATQPAGELSTGLRARLKLALAIQSEPRLLLLDEPGAGLDAEGNKLLEEICVRQLARGALVIATNDLHERRLGNLELKLAG